MAIPYLNSKITLISKSDVRYEGILSSVEPRDATVTLSSVRCFGTEDRRPASEAVAPSTDVYDYIIFRATDIKDLQVAPAPVTDPAILSYKVAASGAPASSSSSSSASSAPASSSSSASSASASSTQEQSGRGKRDDSSFNSRPASGRGGRGGARGGHSQQERHHNNAPHAHGHSNNRRPHEKAAPADAASQPESISGDFDFASSNAKFTSVLEDMKKKSDTADSSSADVSSSEIDASLADASAPAVKKYTKSSFFDDISTARDERERAPVSRQQIRAIDQQTFGTLANSRRGGAHGGRGRGRGGNFRRSDNANWRQRPASSTADSNETSQ